MGCPLLQENDIPIFVLDAVLYCDVVQLDPFAGIVFGILVGGEIPLAVLIMLLESATAGIKTGDDHVFCAFGFCYVIQKLGSIQTEAAGDRQDFQRIPIT